MVFYDLLVVGGGMAAGRLVQHLSQRGDTRSVAIVSAEDSIGYNRVLLPSVVSGRCSADELEIADAAWHNSPNITTLCNAEVTDINVELGVATISGHPLLHFKQVVFATGAYVPKPNIPGIDLPGVFELRNLRDTHALRSATTENATCIVVGGGLLGIEAADALNQAGAEVHLVHRSETLMGRQLDEVSAAHLAARVENQGIQLSMNQSVLSIRASGAQLAATLDNGTELQATCMVFATGARANTHLAEKANLACHHGILTNKFMEASVSGVFAVGECANVNGTQHQLVEPTFAQAEALAATLCGERTPVQFKTPNTRLKMTETHVFSAGEIKTPKCDDAIIHDPKQGIYRRLCLQGMTLVGAILVGDLRSAREITERIGTALTPDELEHLAFGTN